MIAALSQALKALLSPPGAPAELARAEVVFDRPDERFAPSQTTLSLFLHDLRENMTLRSNQPLTLRHGDVATIRAPALRLACGYLLTAWPVGGPEPALQEQRLLGQALAVLRRHPTLPEAVLTGALQDSAWPVQLTAAQPEGTGPAGEFWSALGGRLRPAIWLTATLALDLDEPAPAEVRLVTRHQVRLDGSASPPRRG